MPARKQSALSRQQSAEEEHCVVCGCTQMNACEGGCSWIEPGLCSNPVCVMFARMFHDLRELIKHRRSPEALRDAQKTVKRAARMLGVKL